MYRHPVRLLALLLLLLPTVVLAQSSDQPNDPSYPDQWALPLIGAPCAWNITTGSPNVTVAVVDSGVDLHHPDLAGRLRSDGYDFVSDTADPSDQNGHGTNVTGIIAATLNNGEGIAGLAPGVKILPVRVMDAKGYGSDGTIARGIRYAADKSAQVINLSLGVTLSADQSVSGPISAAIRYAQSKGALVVVAAGNDFAPLPNAIVGDNADVLVVAATDESDRKAPFSNYGPQISIAAPGVHILSTMPTYEVYLTSSALPADERFERNYDYMSGTSQATPYVSALAALLFSAHPDWNAQQVAQTIKEHASDISSMNPALTRQKYLGSGRIDACNALQSAPVAAHATPVATPEQSGPVVTPAPPYSAPVPVAPQQSGHNSLVGVLGGLCVLVLLLAGGAALMLRARARPAPPTTLPSRAAPDSAAWGALMVLGGPIPARRFSLSAPETLLGRAPECSIVLSGDPAVSRRHAIVRNTGQAVLVMDAGSSHGTYVNGQRISTAVTVRRGDLLQVGQTLLRFE